MTRNLKLVVVTLLATLGVGCAPTLRVNVLQPAPINLGAARRLSIVQTEGRRSAREVVVASLLDQSRAGAFFTAQDRSEEGITVKVLGQRVEVSGGKGPGQSPDEVGVRVDVLSWDAHPEVKTVTRTVQDKVQEKDSKGNVVTKYVDRQVSEQVNVITGKVVLGVTAFNSQGRAILAEREYEGRFDGSNDGRSTEESVLKQAAQEAVSRLLRDITPTYAVKEIRMDDGDEQVKPLIKMAEQGNVGQAADEMAKYVKGNPNSGVGHYDLAVLLDAQGKYQEALEEYSAALRLSTKDYYSQMKAECAKRLADQQALNQQ